jgi:sulfhydrogenase subunit alpha
MKSRVIKVNQLARVEGEGGLHVKISDGRVQDVKLNIFEAPRFFEAFLRQRKYSEAPDITARICGICPVAYQMSSVHAMENAFGVVVDGQLRELRRLLYCGEWIESHVLHIYLLHAPDFLGYEDAIALGQDHPEVVERALMMKKIGNDLVGLLGGREIHPVNVRVGGFYRVPTKAELLPFVERLKRGVDAAVETAKLVAGFEFPPLEIDYDYVALTHQSEYPFNEGRICSTRGLNLDVREFEVYFEERHVAHSNALHGYQKGGGTYNVGPSARFSLNRDRLTPVARQVADELTLHPPIRNPFKSIMVRSIETIFAYEEALRIINQYEMPGKPAVPVQPRGGLGFGATEAPRGLLYHRYRIGEDGLIRDARIVPPTAQNQPTIENDVRVLVSANMSLGRDELTWKCEQAIRNYDPCISCATHFVRLTVENT